MGASESCMCQNKQKREQDNTDKTKNVIISDRLEFIDTKAIDSLSSARREIDDWIRNQKQEMEEFKQKLRTERNLDNNNSDMQKQIDSLKSINKALEKRLGSIETTNKIDNIDNINKIDKIDNIDKIDRIDTDSVKFKLSQEQIDQFVEGLLNDENVNIKYLPDYVERQLYRNMFTILLEVIKHTTNTAEIKFLGHTMTFVITPDSQTIGNSQTIEK